MKFRKSQRVNLVVLGLVLLIVGESTHAADKLAVRQKVPVDAGKLLPSVF